ncbi:YchJ family metal-binding protein [Fusobacterium sp.]|nr:YchJ family metal-binding protein [Fusobacterium sp.]
MVEFKARYIDSNGEEVVHHERSYFVKKGRHWYYKGWLEI